MSTPREPNELTVVSQPGAVAAMTPPMTATPLATPEPGIPWTRYASAIWRYKWLVVLMTLAGAGAGLFAARRIRPTFDVHATLWLSQNNRRTDDGHNTGELVNNSSWIDLLRSYTILERVAARAGMQLVPALPADAPLFAGFVAHDGTRTGAFDLQVDANGDKYTLQTPTGTVLETGAVGDSIGRAFGFSWRPGRELLPAGSKHSFAVQTLRDAANVISGRLTTTQPEGTSFIRLTLTGTDPKATADLLNLITDEFITVSTELKKRSVVAQSARLAEQARSAEASLRGAEQALQRFRVASITLPADVGSSMARANGGDPLLTRYMDEKSELDAVRTDRAQIENALDRLRNDMSSIDYVLTLPVLTTRAPELRAAIVELSAKHAALLSAQRQYTDEHKIVRDLRDAERQLRTETIPRLGTARVEQMRQRERELQSSVATSAQSLEGIPPRTLEELRLRRNVALAENLFAKVQNEYESASLSEAGMVADVSVLDRAVAPVRTPQGRARQLAALFTTFGGFGGIVLALLLDAGDKRLRYRSQVDSDMDLVVLGSVPRLRRRARGNAIEQVQLVESMRGIRVGIAYALGGQSPMQLTITSPNISDGKSLVSSNLAISFAEGGYRTLLVDGDIRRGALHEAFGVQRRPGLLDCLATDLPLEDAITATHVNNLSILPCGTRYRQGPEMLAGPGLSNLLARVRDDFDMVIVDSPPLSLGSDALWESIATGAVAVVLRMNQSDRHVAKSSLGKLDRLPVQVIGAIVNDIPMAEESDYYRYLSQDNVDADSTLPQRGSQIGLVSSGR